MHITSSAHSEQNRVPLTSVTKYEDKRFILMRGSRHQDPPISDFWHSGKSVTVDSNGYTVHNRMRLFDVLPRARWLSSTYRVDRLQ